MKFNSLPFVHVRTNERNVRHAPLWFVIKAQQMTISCALCAYRPIERAWERKNRMGQRKREKERGSQWSNCRPKHNSNSLILEQQSGHRTSMRFSVVSVETFAHKLTISLEICLLIRLSHSVQLENQINDDETNWAASLCTPFVVGVPVAHCKRLNNNACECSAPTTNQIKDEKRPERATSHITKLYHNRRWPASVHPLLPCSVHAYFRFGDAFFSSAAIVIAT